MCRSFVLLSAQAAFSFVLLLQPPVARAQYDGSTSVPEPLVAGFESISAEQSEAWLSILAGPVFEGRGTGQVGYVRAAHWVAGKVAEFGLKPMGDGGTYFQMLPMSRQFIDDSQSKLTGPNDLSIPFAKNIALERFSSVSEVAGKVVIVKLVGDRPQIEENSLTDKVVIYVTDEKNERRASQIIGNQRPAARFRVVPSTTGSANQLQRPGRASTSLSGTITQSAATLIANAIGGSSEWIKIGEGGTSEVHSADSQLKVQFRIREEQAAVPNVLAWQEGSDPQLRDEYVVIGAHLDHLGIQGDQVFPGADDNGSGSTALLNIAKAISTNPIKPKRSVLFMWFAAEEIGLVGSAHYVNSPILPLEKMICMLNIDMVGRNEEKGDEPASQNENTLHLIGSQKGDKSLHELILEANKHINFTFEFDEENVFGRSDQINFFKKGTSVAFLFGGFHPDYHRPSDGPSKINYKKIASAAKLFYLTTHFAADHGHFPVPQPEEKPAK
jgi:Zn-dependent M28 family amino/carboxypeptidase